MHDVEHRLLDVLGCALLLGREAGLRVAGLSRELARQLLLAPGALEGIPYATAAWAFGSFSSASGYQASNALS